MKKKNNTAQDNLSFMQGEKWENESPEYKKWFLYYDKKYTLTSKRRLITGIVLGALLIGGGIGTSIYFGVREGSIIADTIDQRNPSLVDDSKYDLTITSRTAESIVFTVTPKIGEKQMDGLDIKIGSTHLSSDEFTFENGTCTIPSTTLHKYSGHIFVDLVFNEHTKVYLDYSEIHVTCDDTKSFYIPYVTTDSGKIKWSSSNPSIASVDEETGEIQLATGLHGNETVTITAKATDNESACTLTILPSCASNITFEEIVYDGVDALRAKCKNQQISGEITIPGCYNGKIVASIGSFVNCTAITKVNLPESIVAINGNAFYGCTALTYINIPKAVYSIGSNIFGNITSGNFALDFETKTSEWTNSNSTTFTPSIYASLTECAAAFISFNSYTATKNGIKSEDGNLMYYYTSEVTCSVSPTSKDIEGGEEGEIIIPATVTDGENTYKVDDILYDYTQSKSSFYNCNKIKKISIPSTIEYIPDKTFAFCNSLEEINVDGDNPTYASLDGVLYTKHLDEILRFPVAKTTTQFEILPTVKTIRAYSLMYAKYLETVSYGADSILETVGTSAFFCCYNLKSISFPSSLKLIGYDLLNVYTTSSSFKITSITFEDPNNFVYNNTGVAVDLSDPSNNANEWKNGWNSNYSYYGVAKVS